MHEAHAQELLRETIHRILQSQPVRGAQHRRALFAAREEVQREALIGPLHRRDFALLRQRGNAGQVLRHANQQVHVGPALRLFVIEQETARAEHLLPIDPQVVERHRQGNGVIVLQFAARHAAGQRSIHGSFLQFVTSFNSRIIGHR